MNRASEKLRAWREKNGLTQEQMGIHVGCTGAEIGRLERGGKPSIDGAFRLENALLALADDTIYAHEWVSP